MDVEGEEADAAHAELEQLTQSEKGEWMDEETLAAEQHPPLTRYESLIGEILFA